MTIACKPCLKQHGQTLAIIICSIAGFSVGQGLRQLEMSEIALRIVEIPSLMMMKCFTMLVVPLIFCGVTLGMASMRKTGSDKIVGITLLFFVGLMALSSSFGCVLVQVFHPGHAIAHPSEIEFELADQNANNNSAPPPLPDESVAKNNKILSTVFDFFGNAVPDNLLTAAFMKRYTVEKSIPSSSDINSTMIIKRSSEIQFSTNYIGLLFICILLGFAIASLGEKAAPVYSIIESINFIIMKILEYLIKVLPVGIFFWLCNQGLRTEDPLKVFSSMAYFLVLYVSTQIVYQALFLPLLYLAIVRKNPFKFYGNLFTVVMTAFGCASSAATLPVTIRCMEEKNKVATRITQFVLPLGVILNMQGGAMGNPISTIFIAQMEGIETGLVHSIILCAISVLFAMASPGIPSTGSPVSFLTSLNIIGIEKAYFVGMMVAVDWFIDRFRTTTNVIGDCFVAAFVEKLCWKDDNESTINANPEEKNIPDYRDSAITLSNSQFVLIDKSEKE